MAAVISALGVTVSNAEPFLPDIPPGVLAVICLIFLVCFVKAFFRAFRK